MAIKCVMLDFGNVLVHFDTPEFYRFLNGHRRSSFSPEQLFTGQQNEVIVDYDLGKIGDETFYELMRELFDLEGVNRDIFFKVFGSVMHPDPKMLELKKLLKMNDLELVMVSNINKFHLSQAFKKYPEYVEGFDYRSMSCEMEKRKPDPEMWVQPLDFLGRRSEECLFIDDFIVNVEAFRELGGLGYYYNVTDDLFCPNGKLEMERGKLFSACRSLGLIS